MNYLFRMLPFIEWPRGPLRPKVNRTPRAKVGEPGAKARRKKRKAQRKARRASR